MVELADIFRASATIYLEKHGQRILFCLPVPARQTGHRWAIRDTILCRTEVVGDSVYRCKQCEDYRYSYHLCKNRHCLKCGNDTATAWLAAQGALLLPVRHFLVTTTLPASLQKLLRRNQKLIYSLMMRCAAQAIQPCKNIYC